MMYQWWQKSEKTKIGEYFTDENEIDTSYERFLKIQFLGYKSPAKNKKKKEDGNEN